MKDEKNIDAPAPAGLWNVGQAAKYLGVSRRWLFDRLRLAPTLPGSVPHIRLGRAPRFLPDVLRAWTEAGAPPVADFEAQREARKRARRGA